MAKEGYWVVHTPSSGTLTLTCMFNEGIWNAQKRVLGG